MLKTVFCFQYGFEPLTFAKRSLGGVKDTPFGERILVSKANCFVFGLLNYQSNESESKLGDTKAFENLY